MPFVKDTTLTNIKTLPDLPQDEALDPSVGEVFGAAFRQENSLISAASNGFGLYNFQAEEDYDPFDGDIEGYELFAENFIESKSRQETMMIKSQIDMELDDKKILAASGVTGFGAQIVAGATDPIFWPMLLIPGGAAVRSSKSIGESAAKLGLIGGISEVPAEAAKQYTQETRTFQESAFNVGGAAVLSGILGGTVKGLSNRQINQLNQKIDDVLQAEKTPIVYGNTASGNLSAAEVPNFTQEQLKPVSIGGLESLGVSPQIRAENSPSLATKSIVSEMMESSTVKQANIDGISVVPEGGSVETRIKSWDAGLYQSIKDLDDFYTQYRGGKGAAARTVNDLVLRNRAGKLTHKQFREEVGRTMRRGDMSTIPEVQKAAESFRKNIIDPLKDAAIREKLLPPDVEVSTATSYLTRIYNTQKIAAKRNEWDAIVQGWLSRNRDQARLKVDPDDAVKAEANLTDLEIKGIAEDITNNILGVSSGRVPYEIVPNVRGPLKERTFNIPDSLIEDFLESDIDLVARQYKRTLAPDVELTRMYGSADMTEQLEEIIPNSYRELIDKSTTEKQRLDLDKRIEADQRDIAAMRDRLRGNYLIPNDPNSFFIRAGKTLRSVNFLRMLGGMTISAIPDLARPVAVNGLRPVARSLRALAISPRKVKMSLEEARRSAVGLDMVLNSRATSMAEITDIYARTTPFERGLNAMSDAFGRMTLMTQWNAALKQFSGVITQDRILAAVVDVADGKASKSTIKRLAASGIGKEQAEAIAIQFRKYGDSGDLNLSNGQLWDDKETLETFRNAVLKDVDRTVITPGEGEKPLWTSSEQGKMIFQFKSFAATAHNKILVADLQYRDAQALSGFLLATGLGMMTYGLKEYFAGREVSREPEKVILEGLDRSGVFGYMWDVNNIMEKLTRGEVGANKVIGGSPMSRYASRNVLGALLGPSVGTVEDLATISGSISTGEFSESDLRKVRKMLPGQNLFYMRRLLNNLEEQVGENL